MVPKKDKTPEIPVLDFERPIVELQRKIATLKHRSRASTELTRELHKLESHAEALQKRIFSNLTPWQKVQLARHPGRPYTLDYIPHLFTDFRELHGDRAFADDAAMIAGIAFFDGRAVVVMGQQKGRKTKEKLARNLGMAKPEGYRKTMRLMSLAARFGHPVLCLLDTPGAFPGIDAEERGQAEAVAKSLEVMAALPVPIISVVIGEGGSGGALGIAVADRVAMLEHAWYSVISPEGCAAILWKEANEQTNNKAAECLALTARRNLENGLVDEVISEPLGGAHRDPRKAADNLQTWLVDRLRELSRVNPETLVRQRFEKFRKMGAYRDELAVAAS